MDPSVPVSLPWEDCPAEVQVETVWPDFSAGRKVSFGVWFIGGVDSRPVIDRGVGRWDFGLVALVG